MKSVKDAERLTVIRDAVHCIDELLALGDLEQQCIVSLRFEEMKTYTLLKERYMSEKRDLFKAADAIIYSPFISDQCKEESELKNACSILADRAFQLKLQNRDTMSLLNQVKAFFASLMCAEKEIKGYNSQGKMRVSGGAALSLINKKV